MSRPPLALKLRLYYTKTTNAHLPKDTSTHFPAAVQLTNVKSHGSCQFGRFCTNLYNFHFYFISARQVGAQDRHGDNRKFRTLSTTGKPVQIFQYCRQRLLCEPAFQILSTLAQEHACDSYARQDDTVLSYCDKQLPKKRLTTLNAINQAPLEATVGKRLPVSFHGAPANRKRKQLDAMAVVTRMGKPKLHGNVHSKPQMARDGGKLTQRPDRNGSPRFS